MTLPILTKREAIDAVKKLDAQKTDLERQLSALEGTLSSQNVGMSEPLVDKDGYPRADIDVYNVRQTRAIIIRLRNDYKELLGRVDKALIAMHAAPDENGVDVEMKGDEVIAFATVNAVAPDSPSYAAKLQRGDRIIKFGTLTIDALRNGLQPLSQYTEANENKSIQLLVDRDGTQIELNLTPTKWSGRGLLGDKIMRQSVLYHSPASFYSRFARLVLAECDVDYKSEIVDIDVATQTHSSVAAQHLTPEYLHVNSRLTVPAMELAYPDEEMDDEEAGGPVLDDSRSIMSYCKDIQPSLFPTGWDTWIHLFYQLPAVPWSIVASNNTQQLKFHVMREHLLQEIVQLRKDLGVAEDELTWESLVQKHMFLSRISKSRPESIVNRYQESMDLALEKLEGHLLGIETDYVLGDDFSIVECCMGTVLYQMEEAGHSDRFGQATKQYYELIKTQPSWKTAIEDYKTDFSLERLKPAVQVLAELREQLTINLRLKL
ncbi:hypothetical protein SmJEL517_g00426 [Synchytrium microbalum]|uniref:Probable 26S proteasome regulatory subunit p27 n=1 Tax=Synchytrium microbalum TaxID=1806994 RepID=A0A507CH82_9FUNG|nr:uncharacterized protein SmJEL517_g00426 [Synchytrium microbalum]TPX37426.1 hypothetical protein SmJEL517_g00426 [Synchytrium microbalum]